MIRELLLLLLLLRLLLLLLLLRKIRPERPAGHSRPRALLTLELLLLRLLALALRRTRRGQPEGCEGPFHAVIGRTSGRRRVLLLLLLRLLSVGTEQHGQRLWRSVGLRFRVSRICVVGVPRAAVIRLLEWKTDGTIGPIAMLPMGDNLPGGAAVGNGTRFAGLTRRHVVQHILHGATMRQVTLHDLAAFLRDLLVASLTFVRVEKQH